MKNILGLVIGLLTFFAVETSAQSSCCTVQTDCKPASCCPIKPNCCKDDTKASNSDNKQSLKGEANLQSKTKAPKAVRPKAILKETDSKSS